MDMHVHKSRQQEIPAQVGDRLPGFRAQVFPDLRDLSVPQADRPVFEIISDIKPGIPDQHILHSHPVCCC